MVRAAAEWATQDVIPKVIHSDIHGDIHRAMHRLGLRQCSKGLSQTALMDCMWARLWQQNRHAHVSSGQ
jgi:hypothetical protein